MLKKVASDYEDQCKAKAADFVRNIFYVDDGLRRVNTWGSYKLGWDHKDVL